MQSKKISSLPSLLGLFRSLEKREEKVDSHLFGSSKFFSSVTLVSPFLYIMA